MTSTDLLVAGVIAALFAPDAREYVMLTALGVVIVCVAFATVTQVRMATTLASSMAGSRGDFWIRIIRVLLIPMWLGFFPVDFHRVLQKTRWFGETNRFLETSKSRSATHGIAAVHMMP
jgi:hypothetical protein